MGGCQRCGESISVKGRTGKEMWVAWTFKGWRKNERQKGECECSQDKKKVTERRGREGQTNVFQAAAN